MNKSARKTTALIIGIILVCFAGLFPSLWNVSRNGIRVLAIFIGTVILWLFVDISWPSILALITLSTLPDVGTSGVISASFGNTTIWFLVFSFLITYTLGESGFLRRVALWFLDSTFAKKSPWHLTFMFLLAVLVLGSFIAPTVTFLLFFALHKEVMDALSLKPGSPLARVMMIGTACITSISCAMTPIAHTFPLMAIGFYQQSTGNSISYLSYLKIGLPAGIVLFFLTYGLLCFGYRNKVLAEAANTSTLAMRSSNKLSAEEIFSAVVFFIVVLVWLLGGLLPQKMDFINSLGTTWPAMVGVFLLAFIPIKGKPVLNISKGFQHGVSWTSIMLCAAALAVGRFVSMEEYGITALIGQELKPVLGGLGSVGVLSVLISATVLMTNFMSNIVTTTVIYNVAAAILPGLILAGGLGNLTMQTVAILVGMCASLAFATPPAIAHIALAAGSDWASPEDMLRFGGTLALLSIPVVLVFTII